VLTKGDLMSLKPRAKLDNMVKPFSLLHFIIWCKVKLYN